MTPSMVVNTGPLVALGLLDRIDLLRLLASEIFVPEAVNEEVLAGGRQETGIRANRDATWLVRATPS